MTISQVYLLYPITQMLKEHMIRTASIAESVIQHTKLSEIDRNLIIQVTLIHDTGNIIKFDLEKFPKLLGDQLKDIGYWKTAQKEFIKKYGMDEHVATERIASELGLSKQVLILLRHMIYDNLKDTADGTNWNAKICNYSDLRSGPFKVVSVNERFDDLINRYKGRNHKIGNIDMTEKNRKYCLMIEKQLQDNSDILLESINENLVKKSFTKFDNFSLLTSFS